MSHNAFCAASIAALPEGRIEKDSMGNPSGGARRRSYVCLSDCLVRDAVLSGQVSGADSLFNREIQGICIVFGLFGPAGRPCNPQKTNTS